jgi:hypothetical protein
MSSFWSNTTLYFLQMAVYIKSDFKRLIFFISLPSRKISEGCISQNFVYRLHMSVDRFDSLLKYCTQSFSKSGVYSFSLLSQKIYRASMLRRKKCRSLLMNGDCRVSLLCSNVLSVLNTLRTMAHIKASGQGCMFSSSPAFWGYIRPRPVRNNNFNQHVLVSLCSNSLNLLDALGISTLLKRPDARSDVLFCLCL